MKDQTVYKPYEICRILNVFLLVVEEHDNFNDVL